jgi:hypothetical protein
MQKKEMKKNILIFAMVFIPLFTFGEGGTTHLLSLYRIYNSELRNSLYTYVIPFLLQEKYLSSEKVLNITFENYNSEQYIYVSVKEMKRLKWNDDIIGYTYIAGYTCIFRGNSYNKFIKRYFWNFPKLIVYNNPELFYTDGTIEWLFRLDGERLKFVRFNSEW